MKTFKKGDAVSWNTPNGTTHGKIVSKITSDRAIDGHTANASEDNPQYEVESSKSGKKALHKPESLTKE